MRAESLLVGVRVHCCKPCPRRAAVVRVDHQRSRFSPHSWGAIVALSRRRCGPSDPSRVARALRLLHPVEEDVVPVGGWPGWAESGLPRGNPEPSC